jgi:hypothetical protein
MLLEIGYPYRGRVNGPRLGPETKRDGPFPAPQVIAQHTPANRSGKELDEWGDRCDERRDEVRETKVSRGQGSNLSLSRPVCSTCYSESRQSAVLCLNRQPCPRVVACVSRGAQRVPRGRLTEPSATGFGELADERAAA